MTAVGGAQIDTAQYVVGNSSGLFDGTGDYLTTPDHADFALSNVSWTVQARIRFNALPTSGNSMAICSQLGASNDEFKLVINNNSGTYRARLGSKNNEIDTDVYWDLAGLSTNTWYHMAWVRDSNTARFFLDGTQIGSGQSFTITLEDVAETFYVASSGTSNYYLNGWMDEFEFAVGVARYTGNFTPSTSAIIPDDYTVLLLHCEGTDGSTTFTDDIDMPIMYTKSLSASISVSGSISNSKIFFKNLSAYVNILGSNLKNIDKTLSGYVYATGTRPMIFKKILTGIVSISGNLTKNITKSLTGLISIAGNFVKNIKKRLLGSINTSGTISHAYVTTLFCSGSVEATFSSTANTLKIAATLTDAKTNFFYFDNKVYIQNGTEYYSYNGTSVSIVTGYVPKIAIATPYSGGGTAYEEINTLTGSKHQTFNGDNTHQVFQLAEIDIDSVDSVYVSATPNTDYTADIAAGTVTFTTPPPTGDDIVDIYWTKGSGDRSNVTLNRQSILFGGANDTRVFMYGVNNRIVFSALANELPSAEYFPSNNYLTVGSDEHDVTHISKQYDRIIIHKQKGSYYSNYEYDAALGASFPTYPLNDNIGNIAFAQGQNILNNPFVITNNGVYQFVATNVRDERNAVFTSQRVQLGLDELDLSTAITLDYEKKQEYWLCVGKNVYIYNYKLDVWYYYELADTPTCFLEIDGECWFGTSSGKIMRFSNIAKTDNNTAISSTWETGYLSFDANYVTKFLNFAWIGMQPEGFSKCTLGWESDRGASVDDYIIQYNLLDFNSLNFADFSFMTNRSPHPFRVKFKIKKFTYMKLTGVNNETTYDMTISNIVLPVVFGGRSK